MDDDEFEFEDDPYDDVPYRDPCDDDEYRPGARTAEAAAADVETVRMFFAAAALERVPSARRRYHRVFEHLMQFLDAADLAPHLGTHPAECLAEERRRGSEHAFFRVCTFDDLVSALEGFVSDAWLLPRPGDARTQVSLTARLLVWLQRQRLIDFGRVACAYYDAEGSVRRARDRLAGRWLRVRRRSRFSHRRSRSCASRPSAGRMMSVQMPYTRSMAKTRRFEMRTDEETDQLLTKAAALANVNKSAFVEEAARRAAIRVVAQADVTVMDAAVFDTLVASLDEPDDVPEAAARFRRLPRLIQS